MDKKFIINFDTAKLAKEKGFEETVENGYVVPPEFYGEKIGQITTASGGYHKGMIGLIGAPTQTYLQYWLRTKYKIEVYVQIEYVGALYQYIIKWFDNVNIEQYGSGYTTYEKALEKGLQEALKKL